MAHKYRVEERLGWRRWVTPQLLRDKPVHRWYVFPHSFTGELVHALIDEWDLGKKDRILDPFVGAGTTLLAAKEREIPASGFDLSPLAVLAARTKVANYNISNLKKAWKSVKKTFYNVNRNKVSRPYPELVQKALPGRVLEVFDALARIIDEVEMFETDRDLLRLALLSILPLYSSAIATGGWLKWVEKQVDEKSIPEALTARVEMMLHDLQEVQLPRLPGWQAVQADARQLPVQDESYSAVITSPPYPNRHDYTRVFGIELMFGFIGWEETRQLRYQSFHSHPEARPTRPGANDYKSPTALTKAVKNLREKNLEPRIISMIEGYFLDLYLCLREMKRVCRQGAKIAFVVGNARYCGETILVDELTAEVGEQAGLKCSKLLAVRYRGNSAQQMGRYGRSPSRESVVIFDKS